MRVRGINSVSIGLVGLSVGGLFLWLALLNVSLSDVREVVISTDRNALAFALVLYWIAMAFRVLRWSALLNALALPPLSAVAETLVVGYAINNILPARLGEIARAAYAKSRLKIGRVRVFGSIVVERFLDLAAVLLCLGCGMIVFRLGEDAVQVPAFELVALNAVAVVGVATVGLAIFRSGSIDRIRWPESIAGILRDFRRGLMTLNRRTAWTTCAATCLVWIFETTALWQVFSAVGVDLNLGQAMLIMSVASLSTLVPTAPGYLGTYQLVAVIAMNAFGHGEVGGIVAATAIQIVLFGSVTLVGSAIVATRGIRHAWARIGDNSERRVQNAPAAPARES